jgi:Family of unknown function (DUF6065)
LAEEGATNDPVARAVARADVEIEPFLRAYRTSPSGVRLVPAPSGRAWMDATTNRFANRCLPLKMPNQAGWFVLNDRPVRVVWDGGKEISSTKVEPLREVGEGEHLLCASHFGFGILTFFIPYLFRTPPGYNLLARGPANMPKDGIAPLEGLVETNWSVASFTMNWKLTRPGQEVVFEEGEPVCMIVSQRRGELESFRPEVCELNDDLELAYDYWKWTESRWRTLAENKRRDTSGEAERSRRGYYEQHYTRGTSPTGTSADAEHHQTRLRLRPFEGTRGRQEEGSNTKASEERRES